MRIPRSFKLLLLFFIILIIGCDDITDHPKFQRPDWLPGKLYTTILTQEDISMFAECLQLVGLDTILNVSGSWTVFAPTNEAVGQYLIDNQYAGISDIPLKELERITEFHILQNPWSFDQLKTLNATGWRSDEKINSYSYAYKRQTKFKNPNEKFWIKRVNNNDRVVLDSTQANKYKMVFVQSRKYVPIFYDEYFSISGLTAEDYSFYFNRAFESGNVYYAEAKIIQSNILAENGFVHIIDKVVNPMLNAKEILERELPGESYKLFLEMVFWNYTSFVANMNATYNQPSVRMGGKVDTLWGLNYSDLAFNLHEEQTGYQGGDINETLVRHNGMYIPTDNAFGEFLDGILTNKSGFPHWSDYKSLPKDLLNIIVSRHFNSAPIYPSTISYQEAFRTGVGFLQNEGDIIRREFGSNSTFIGVDSYIPDQVFTSVTGPVFLRPKYSNFRLALLYAQIQDDIAYNEGDLCFFPIPDAALHKDSSLIVNWINQSENEYYFTEIDRDMRQLQNLGSSAIRERILNHVGLSVPDGSANKEFIRTMGGKFLIWNNSDNTVQGNLPSTIGYNGMIPTTCYPVEMNEPALNGRTWSVNYWFNFGGRNLYFTLIAYPEFFRLLDKAGIVNRSSLSISFLDRNVNYTVFVPSDEALNNYQADTLNIEELTQFLKYHFVKGAMIFTDNKQLSNYYNTESGDPMNIRIGPDIIEILDKYGNLYFSIPEDPNSTNLMVIESSAVSSVVHEIDKVLVY